LGSIILGDLSRPLLVEADGMLGIDRGVEYVQADRSARSEIRVVHGIKGVQVCKDAIPLILEWIAEVHAGDVLACQVLPGHDGFERSVVSTRRWTGPDMAIVQGGGQLILVHIGKSYAVGILGPQLGIPFHKGIIVQFELEGIQVLVGGPVDPPGIIQVHCFIGPYSR